MTITPTLARMIVSGGLRHLPPEQRERYREECEADLAQLDDSAVRMLIHALQTAAYGRPLRLTLGVAPARRSDPLRRRALAHLGFPREARRAPGERLIRVRRSDALAPS